MSRRLEIRPEARADIEAAHGWYEQQRRGLGDEFVAALDLLLKAVLRNPHTHACVHHRIRRALLHRFPYGLYYLSEPDAVVVLACTHLRRHPRRWRSRQ